MRWLRSPRARRILGFGLLGLLLALAVAPFVVGTDARHLSAFRDGPEEMGLARAELSSAVASLDAITATPHALADVKEPTRALYVAVGTERRYDADEAAAVLEFLRSGGNVLLADEGGFGTDVAREAGWAFGSQRLLDTRNHRGDPRLPVTDARAAQGGETYRVLLNSPSVLTEVAPSGALVLASTSAAQHPNGSYLDINGNGEIDLADPPGPFPLVVRAKVGEGTLLLVADTGLFMDAQLAQPGYDNGAYLRALVRSLVPADGRVLFDEARHAPPASTALWDHAVRALGRATTGALAPFLLVGALLALTLLAWRLTRPTEDWSRHAHSVSAEVPAPEGVRPDAARAQRLARRRISEKYNIPMEQVASMTGEELLRATGDKLLADAAAGTLRDPAPLFQSFSTEASP